MMNRSAVAKTLCTLLTAATVACGTSGSGPAAERTAGTPSRVAAKQAPAAAAATAKKTSRRKQAALARAAAASAGGTGGSAVPARYAAFAAAFDLDAYIGFVPGAAVALIEHGKVTFTHAVGTTAVNGTTPVDADTIFRVGTMTQPLTAALELALVDQGKGSLAETLPTLVPGVSIQDPSAASVTTRELLSNQSGLFDFTTWSYDLDLLSLSCSTDPASLQSFVAGSLFAQNEVFMTPPGAIYEASNPNFILAGAGIEKQSGSYFTDAARSLLFAPLGMSRSFFVPSEVVAAGNYADGTSYDQSGNLIGVAPTDYDCAAYRPYGYAFSSVNDYAKFVQMLLAGNPKVLSDASRLAMESPQVQTRDLGHVSSEGYGLTVSKGYLTQSNAYYATKTVSSQGQIEGYGSLFYGFPDTGFGVVILSNFSATQFGDSIDLAVQRFAGLPPPSALPANNDSVPGKFARYAGTYEDPTGSFGTIVISDTGGALTVDFPDASTLGLEFWPQLSPTLDDGFLVTFFGYPNVLQFMTDSSGRYTYLLIDDTIAATRIAADAGP
ncbi:MAG TPA: serine hydrolase [Polyangiaceae bacterium]